MNRSKLIWSLAVVGGLLSNCNNQETAPAPEVTAPETPEAAPAINKDSIVTFIDGKRAAIEALTEEPLVMETTNMREKIKQKWSKFHIYAVNGQVVKIKTYPHAEVSKRTEEFYAIDNNLVMVVIEDNGEGAKGKPKADLDKIYYFHNNEMLAELSKGAEKEFGIRNSDAEELQAEFLEYVAAFSTKK